MNGVLAAQIVGKQFANRRDVHLQNFLAHFVDNAIWAFMSGEPCGEKIGQDGALDFRCPSGQVRTNTIYDLQDFSRHVVSHG